jgi:hypothetical protein
MVRLTVKYLQEHPNPQYINLYQYQEYINKIDNFVKVLKSQNKTDGVPFRIYNEGIATVIREFSDRNALQEFLDYVDANCPAVIKELTVSTTIEDII